MKVKDAQWQVRKGVFLTLGEIFKIYTPEEVDTESYKKVKQ